MEITLRDVEIAIKVLNEFYKKSREAERVLRRLGISRRSSSIGGLSFERIYQMAVEQAMARKGLTVSQEVLEQETELTEEELKRLREIADKIKNKG